MSTSLQEKIAFAEKLTKTSRMTEYDMVGLGSDFDVFDLVLYYRFGALAHPLSRPLKKHTFLGNHWAAQM